MNKNLLIFIIVTAIFSFFSPKTILASDGVLISEKQWVELSSEYDFTENFKTPKQKEKKKIKKNHQIQSKPFSLKGLAWVRYLVILIVILLLITVLVILIISLIKDSREKISAKIKDNNKNIENIENVDLESMLQESISGGLFKEAVRVKYLILLRTLNSISFIKWKKDKTNRIYIEEMNDKKGSDLFKNITTIFERIWYGEKDFNEQSYKKVEILFNQINEVIS